MSAFDPVLQYVCLNVINLIKSKSVVDTNITNNTYILYYVEPIFEKWAYSALVAKKIVNK